MKITIDFELGTNEDSLTMANTILSIIERQLKEKTDKSKEDPEVMVTTSRSIRIIEFHE